MFSIKITIKDNNNRKSNILNYENDNMIKYNNLAYNNIKNHDTNKKTVYFSNSTNNLKAKINKEIIDILIKDSNINNINYLTYRSKSCNNIFDKNDNNKFYNIYKKYESLKINNGNNIIYAFSNKQNSAIHKDIKEKTILRENTYDNKNNLKHEINDFQFFAYNKSNKNINKKIIDRYGEENYLISDNYELFKIKKTNLQKTSFQVFIKSNNYSKIQYLNIIKDLNKKIMQLENEMKQ